MNTALASGAAHNEERKATIGVSPSSSPQPLSFCGVHVLLIDDDAGTRETFERILRCDGYDVLLASAGREGIRVARRSTPDLVLVDLRLPDITGLETLRQLRLARVDVPCVVMTGFGSTESAMEAGRLGAAAYIEKPIFADRLLNVVRSYTRRGVSQPTFPEQRGSLPNHRAILAVLIIDERHREPDLNVAAVARDVGVSTEHLCRVLKHHTGGTFVDLLHRARIREARGLLETTTMSVKEIAYQVGLPSPSTFDHVFKAVAGVSPTEYRITAGVRFFERSDRTI